MRILPILFVSAAFGFVVSPVTQAAEPRIPPALAAKRAGLPQREATPSPLEMLFTPMIGCRAFKQAKILANQTRNFQITGNTGFSAQGGPAMGCGIPASAQAVSISLTANASVKGFLTAYPQGAARPPTNLLRYVPHEASTAGATVLLSGAGQMTVYSNQTARVFGDVTGYYAPQIWLYGSPSGTIIDASPRIVSLTRASLGNYTVVVDRDVTSCAGTASSDISGYIMSAYTSGSNVYVYIYNNAGTLSDYWFNLHITC